MNVAENVLAFLLFSMETYHIFGHVNILFRIRLLPRKDLVRLRLYFLVDLMTVFCSSFLFLQKLRWLATIQILQHMYYVLFWEKTNPAKKIISWSSIDWIKSDHQSEWHLDSILGTLFDVIVHLTMAIALSSYLTTVEIIFSLVLAQCTLCMVLWSPKYAWSNPWNVPKWVAKRLQPISEDKAKLF